jgi:hypothetical protein
LKWPPLSTFVTFSFWFIMVGLAFSLSKETIYDVSFVLNQCAFCSVFSLYFINFPLQPSLISLKSTLILIWKFPCQTRVANAPNNVEMDCTSFSGKCYHVLNWFFLSNFGFLEFIWIFDNKNNFKNNISHILIQILPNKFHYILFIEILPITPKAHSNSFEIFSYDLINFSMKKSFNKQKLLHCKSKRRGTNPVHPSPRAFQRHQKHGMKHPDLMDSKTKQTTFLHK